MRKIITTLIAVPLVLGAVAGSGRAYTVTLIYRNTVPLMDENMAVLEDGSIVQLIFSDDLIQEPPALWNGHPTGDDVLWETTSIGTGVIPPGTGRFLDMYQYDSANLGKYVYVRFFNSTVMSSVSFYGQSPMHTLTDFFQLDIWDITAGGLYLWTEYPIKIIPEPETWLTFLPAVLFAIFIYRKKKRKTGCSGNRSAK